MSREIKFRGWGNGKKKMYYGNFAVNPDGTTKTWGIYEHLILMQYTGLKDKDGKEIYEGDIVRKGKTIGITIFEDGKFGWNIYYEKPEAIQRHDCIGIFYASKKTSNELEIIGNIWENPELIERD